MILENASLKPFNTFGIDVNARYFTRFDSVQALKQILKDFQNIPLLVLGGGSNVLFSKHFDGLVVKNEIKGIACVEENDESVVLKSGAGEVWHDFVLHCIDHGYAGVENLSLIPGSVGASPMQNIGAYGVEIKNVFEKLEAFEIATGEIHTFDNAACEFGYRESVFKRKLKGKYIITHVYFRLSKKINLNTTYGAIETELKSKGILNPNIKDVSDAVIAIRKSKLPDPAVIGNAGSFFKNPVVETAVFEKIKSEYPTVPSYPVSAGFVKMPAGWLIETAGWKGKTIDNYGVHKLQALVLVNYGGATGVQLFDLSTAILKDVFDKFGILLDREVNII
ncbi:MAG: UDP-N-acetylmuramate dehydrogenase [Crocinitomicaceae bacterium]|nr:MAG: UDP-N-acetylmuramate dehydrogenase [Crocinitomicaceae bacterium]